VALAAVTGICVMGLMAHRGGAVMQHSMTILDPSAGAADTRPWSDGDNSSGVAWYDETEAAARKKEGTGVSAALLAMPQEMPATVSFAVVTQSAADDGSAAVALPEPGTAAFLVVAGIGLLMRRRRLKIA